MIAHPDVIFRPGAMETTPGRAIGFGLMSIAMIIGSMDSESSEPSRRVTLAWNRSRLYQCSSSGS